MTQALAQPTDHPPVHKNRVDALALQAEEKSETPAQEAAENAAGPASAASATAQAAVPQAVASQGIAPGVAQPPHHPAVDALATEPNAPVEEPGAPPVYHKPRATSLQERKQSDTGPTTTSP